MQAQLPCRNATLSKYISANCSDDVDHVRPKHGGMSTHTRYRYLLPIKSTPPRVSFNMVVHVCDIAMPYFILRNIRNAAGCKLLKFSANHKAIIIDKYQSVPKRCPMVKDGAIHFHILHACNSQPLFVRVPRV